MPGVEVPIRCASLDMADKDDAPPSAALKVWYCAWPIAALAFGLLLNARLGRIVDLRNR
jgi:hypothetical protein